MIVLLFKESSRAKDLGLLVLRVGIGLIFICHGYPKLFAGPEKWLWLGGNMVHVGITFAPTFWGFMGALSECIGGALLIAGFCTRIAAFFMSCVMLVAFMMHYNQGDAFSVFAHPLSLLVVFISLIISGAGAYSIDSSIK